jgi:hypothetical protein
MICQSIETKYLRPTNNRGARVKATASGGASVTISYGHEKDDDMEHVKALTELVNKLGWHGEWHGGAVKGGARVWVCGTYSVTINAPEPTMSLDALR